MNIFRVLRGAWAPVAPPGSAPEIIYWEYGRGLNIYGWGYRMGIKYHHPTFCSQNKKYALSLFVSSLCGVQFTMQLFGRRFAMSLINPRQGCANLIITCTKETIDVFNNGLWFRFWWKLTWPVRRSRQSADDHVYSQVISWSLFLDNFVKPKKQRTGQFITKPKWWVEYMKN